MITKHDQTWMPKLGWVQQTHDHIEKLDVDPIKSFINEVKKKDFQSGAGQSKILFIIDRSLSVRQLVHARKIMNMVHNDIDAEIDQNLYVALDHSDTNKYLALQLKVILNPSKTKQEQEQEQEQDPIHHSLNELQISWTKNKFRVKSQNQSIKEKELDPSSELLYIKDQIQNLLTLNQFENKTKTKKNLLDGHSVVFFTLDSNITLDRLTTILNILSIQQQRLGNNTKVSIVVHVN